MNFPKYDGNIVLTGMPGSGKTTIGKRLKERLGYDFCDFDDDILEKITLETAEEVIGVLNLRNNGITPEKLANQEVEYLLGLLGDDKFLELEGFLGKKLKFETPTVLSTSGSLPLSLNTMDNLRKNGKVIYINTPLEVIMTRLKEMKRNRIVGMGKMTLEKILEYRDNYYNITKDFDFKVPIFELREGKTKEERDNEKNIIFGKFMEFYNNEVLGIK
ncbi:MAG: shikimate kinase [Candidatus Gracilibacteria bacterium]|nr:shikimate kinase [Candidatus Gracilibacteria bacterium]